MIPTYPTITINQAISDLKQGKMLIVVDDASREDQADLIFPAETVTEEKVNVLLQQCRGMICVPLTQDYAYRLRLPLMVNTLENTEVTGVNFTVTVDAREVNDFGISAKDRTKTIATIADPATTPDHLVRPGHVFPLLAARGGLAQRQGHTEATVTLCQLAGFSPCGVLCEILDDAGNVAKGNSLVTFAKRNDIRIVTIPDLVMYAGMHPRSVFPYSSSVRQTARTILPTRYGTFDLITYQSVLDNREHAVLLMRNSTEDPLLTRIHSQCLTGDTFFSLRCDCGEQLKRSMELISKKKHGIIVYLNQEGRGIGLSNKIRAYALQDQGMDTVEANYALGFPPDIRDYVIAADILHDLRVSRIRLLTNNPKKTNGLEQQGIIITDQVPLEIPPNTVNHKYLKTKKEKLGHQLDLV